MYSPTIVMVEGWVELNPAEASSAVMEQHHKCQYLSEDMLDGEY